MFALQIAFQYSAHIYKVIDDNRVKRTDTGRKQYMYKYFSVGRQCLNCRLF